MPKTLEIRMTQIGYEVSAGGRTSTFRSLDDAVRFARNHLERAEEIRDLKCRID